MKTLRDAGGGLLIATIGLLFLLGAGDMALGDLRNMGPGMFPTALSVVAIVAGLAIAVIEVLRGSGGAIGFDFRALACVAVAIALYAVMLEAAGVVLTTIVAVFVLALARLRGFRDPPRPAPEVDFRSLTSGAVGRDSAKPICALLRFVDSEPREP